MCCVVMSREAPVTLLKYDASFKESFAGSTMAATLSTFALPDSQRFVALARV